MYEVIMERRYGDGTRLDHSADGGCVWGKALCADGDVRAVRFPRGGHADTFFSVPAVCTIKGKTVTGFVTIETRAGYTTASDDDPTVVKFVINRYGKHADII